MQTHALVRVENDQIMPRISSKQCQNRLQAPHIFPQHVYRLQIVYLYGIFLFCSFKVVYGGENSLMIQMWWYAVFIKSKDSFNWILPYVGETVLPYRLFTPFFLHSIFQFLIINTRHFVNAQIICSIIELFFSWSFTTG